MISTKLITFLSMKRKTTEGEVSDTYQNLANATKADLYVTPHDALNRIPIEQVLARHQRTLAQSRVASIATF
ncbi:hypothetical protein Bca101_064248 [Brassica carinata]